MAQSPKARHGDAVFYGFTDFNKNEARNLRLHQLGNDPASPVNGQVIYRTDTHKVRSYVNGAWQDLATMADVTAAGISANIVDAKGDLIVGSADNTVVRKAAGTNGHALFANSVSADGLEWRQIAAADISGLGALATLSTVGTTQIADNSVTYVKMQDVSAASRILGRGSAAGAGDPQELTVSGGVEISGTVIQTAAYTGDVTKAAGGTATTISNDAVTNAKLANMGANTIKGNNTGGSADPLDLTTAQVKTMLAIAPGDITGFDTQVRSSRLDQMAAPTASVSLNSQKITNLADGTAATDAATFGQLSAAIQGMKWKDPVDAATTANIGSFTTAPNTLDGVTLVVGDRILVKDQTTTAQNGIYEVTTVGTGANGVWARTTDADSAAELTDATVLVQGGTVNAGDVFTQTATIATVGTTAQTWTKTGEGNTTYTADGTTIELVGSQFRIAATAAGNGLGGGGASALSVNTGAGLEINTDAVRIATSAAGNGLTGGGGSALSVQPVASGGIAVAAGGVSVDTAIVVRKVAGALTGGSNSEVLTHNLNTRDIAKVALVNSVSPYDALEEPYWEATSVNTITIYAGSGYTLPTGYRWIIHG